MTYALLFSGQGHQHAAMLRWMTGGALTNRMEALLGVADWRRALADGDWGSTNANAQVLIVAAALSAWEDVAGSLPLPAVVAGYSVGELAAHAAAGVLDPGQAVELAAERAAAMDRCGARAPGGLVGVTGATTAQIARACALHSVEIAIRNAPQSHVLGGRDPALEAASAQLASCGARCSRLNIALASHTSLMRQAAADFASTLTGARLAAPATMLIDSFAEPVRSPAGAAAGLAAQIARTVLWDDCLEFIRARRVSCVLEIGAGAALASMWNQRFDDVPARSADEFHTRQALVDWVLRNA